VKREGFSFNGAPSGRSRRGLHSVINEIVHFSLLKKMNSAIMCSTHWRKWSLYINCYTKLLSKIKI
jgi:hypothetical protein